MTLWDYVYAKKIGGGGGTIVSKTITANGTYNASDDSADGYSPVIVNVVNFAHGYGATTFQSQNLQISTKAEGVLT